jgi:hypothetical protein
MNAEKCCMRTLPPAVVQHSRVTENFHVDPTANLSNKLVIYKVMLKPIWTYGIELRGCAKKPSNTKILQTYQSKTLR